MKKTSILILLALIIFIGILILKNKQSSTITSLKNKNMIVLDSSAFKNGGTLPKKYTCDGEGVNPPLTIDNVPTNAKSLILIIDDPDAPMGIFNHWLVWNIDPNSKEIKENSIPANSIQGTNDYGENKYGAPCPPFGMHRYYFRIYALDIELNLEQTTKRSQLEEAIKNHILDRGEMIGKYSK